MKQFISDLFHFLLSILMVLPIHRFRIFILRSSRMKIGSHTAICRNVEVRCPYRISVGSHTSINKFVLLDGRGGNLRIGNCVDIAQECNIWTLQHDYNSESYAAIGDGVTIEDYVWLASRVTILPGVTIGRGSVIGACSVVTKNIPPMSIAVGIPAKIIGKRKDCLMYKLGKRGWLR